MSDDTGLCLLIDELTQVYTREQMTAFEGALFRAIVAAGLPEPNFTVNEHGRVPLSMDYDFCQKRCLINWYKHPTWRAYVDKYVLKL